MDVCKTDGEGRCQTNHAGRLHVGKSLDLCLEDSPRGVRHRKLLLLQKEVHTVIKPPVVKARGPRGRVGSRMKAILVSIDIHSKPGCSCDEMARLMDSWGIDGCKKRKHQLAGTIKDNMEEWGWGSLVVALTKAVFTGLAFKLISTDPILSLVELAISREEASTGKLETKGDGPITI